MPSMLMLSDSQFPRFTDETSQAERIDVIQDYLYQLLEQLRYTLANLDTDNFNESSLNEFGNELTAGLSGEVKVIQESLVGLTGSVAKLTLTGDALKTRVENAEGDISELTQTASQFNVRLSDAEDGVAEISATVNGLTFSVSNGESSSKLKLMSNGVELASATIRITGMVTFDDLEGEGTTVINGSNISTGTIEAIDIYGCHISGSDIELDYSRNADDANGITFNYSGLMCGYMKLFRSSSAPTLYIGTNNEGVNLKVDCDGDMSIESRQGLIYIYGSDYVTIDSDVEVNIHRAVLYTDSGNSWEFLDDGIYFAGEKVFNV